MASLAIQIARLPDHSMSDLRMLWREVFGFPCPHGNNRMFMMRRIAHAWQVKRYGGLSELDRKRLAAYVDETSRKTKGEYKVVRPLPGTVIVRRWHEMEHRVTVLRSGFEYHNVRYNSLTEVARVITGAHQSGPLFFGLSRSSKAKRS